MRTPLFKKTTFCLLMLSSFALASFSAAAQSRDEIIQGSYFVAFGRYANSGELKYWRQYVGNNSIQQMVSHHRNYIKSNQYEKEATIRRSFKDAFGWAPSADEVRYWSGQNKTYGELMTNHINNWLNIYPHKKKLVIQQSYYKVFRRKASEGELQYWMKQPTCSFVQLVAMHTTWQQQNRKYSATTNIKPNINANGVSTALISRSTVNGIIAAGGGNIIATGGGNIIAAGGGNIISTGGGN